MASFVLWLSNISIVILFSLAGLTVLYMMHFRGYIWFANHRAVSNVPHLVARHKESVVLILNHDCRSLSSADKCNGESVFVFAVQIHSTATRDSGARPKMETFQRRCSPCGPPCGISLALLASSSGSFTSTSSFC